MNRYEKEQAVYYTFLIVLLVFNVTWLMSEFL
jgi:hypothetical protein